MTDQSTQEPTMEEILASIRRIISEDDAPVEAEAASAPAEPVAAEAAPSPALMDETPSVQEPEPEEVLELTDTYEAPETETIGDLDVSSAPEPFPTPRAEPGDGLVGQTAAAAAGGAFASLAASVRPPEPLEPDTSGGPTIDQLARALLKPMLKEWLDANLPGIVEAQVRKEVERIARSAG